MSEEDPKLEALQAKYPGKRVRAIETAAGTVYCVQPSRPQYNMFLAAVWDDDVNAKAKAFETLLRACVVDPPPVEFAKWLEDYPGIASDPDVVKELRMLAGAAKDRLAKK